MAVRRLVFPEMRFHQTPFVIYCRANPQPTPWNQGAPRAFPDDVLDQVDRYRVEKRCHLRRPRREIVELGMHHAERSVAVKVRVIKRRVP